MTFDEVMRLAIRIARDFRAAKIATPLFMVEELEDGSYDLLHVLDEATRQTLMVVDSETSYEGLLAAAVRIREVWPAVSLN